MSTSNVANTYESNCEIGIDSVVGQSANQISCELDGETVMMHIETGEYFGCDEIASRVWGLIKEPCSVAAVCNALTEEFDVEREQCEGDVISFLESLASTSLIDVTSKAAAA